MAVQQHTGSSSRTNTIHIGRRRYTALDAPHPGVLLRIEPQDPNLWQIEYLGLPEHLVACGVATLDMTVPARKGPRRVDADGRYFQRRSADGDGRVGIIRSGLTMEQATEMPGVREASAAQGTDARTPAAIARPTDARRAALRLAVDNTWSRQKVIEINPAKDTKALDVFSQLSRHAASGELAGAIVIGMYRRQRPGRKTVLHLTGIASNQPMLAVGALATCEVLVKELALDEEGLSE